jgi:hypothetical protein
MFSLVHLAGRQLLPNLLASMALHRRGTLRRMVVIHSDNPTESARPAAALLDLLQHLPGHAELAQDDPLQMIEVDEDLQTVLAAVRELFADHPGERWVLNATGGNKMMSFALGLLAARPEVHGVVYRDIRHGWRRVVAGADPWRWREEPILAGDPVLGGLVDAENTLERMPIERLVVAQFAAEDVVARIHTKRLPTPLPRVDEWLQHVAQGFHNGFASYRPWQGEPHDDGGGFECWLAALLVTAGATQVLWSCEGLDDRGQKVFECDVVALSADRLVFYDAKLQAPDAGGARDRDAAGRSLGSARARASQLAGHCPRGAVRVGARGEGAAPRPPGQAGA